MAEAVIVSTVRTPIGRAIKGKLKAIRPDELAALAIKAAIARVPTLDPALIEDVLLGCAFPEGEQGFNLARPVSALAGIPTSAGGTTINRFCASALTAVNMAAQAIANGDGDVFVAAGVESMSRVPMGGFNPSFNDKLTGHTPGYPDEYIPMGMTAENVARKWNLSREEQDLFALRSHRNAIAAQDAHKFPEVVPVTLPDGTVVDRDERGRGADAGLPAQE